MNASLERFLPMAAFLAETLPSANEIILFDCTEKGVPVVAHYHEKHRNEDGVRKYLRSVMKYPKIVENGMLTNRVDVGGKKQLNKVSLFFVKDDEGKAVGALAVVFSLSDFFAVSNYVQDLMRVDTTDTEAIEPRQDSYLPEAPELQTIDRIVAEETDAPERCTPEEKMDLIIDLYDEGVFELKGAVTHAAEVLQMSEPSVYRYIAKIKRMRGE